MSTLAAFPRFEEFAFEIQAKIYKEAITEEHRVKVAPVVNSTKRVVLTQDHMRDLAKWFCLSQAAYDAAKSIYDCPLLVTDHQGIERVTHFSTKWDIFLVSPWQFTLGINTNSHLFLQSLNAIPPTTLSKIRQVVEHQLDMGDLVYNPVPSFDRVAYPSARVCYIRVDNQRPSIAALAGELPGAGPHTAADLLNYCTHPARYEERAVNEVVDGEVDGEVYGEGAE
ncbi:hypothetical protein PG984_009831 [Apiospora sp. TS-2023a]